MHAAFSRSRFLSILTASAAALLFTPPAPAAPAAAGAASALQLKDGDVWVMAGDSITAQRQHTNFIEAYYRAHYPKLNLHFRNSGIGGNRTSHILQRFDYDVAAWKPSIVSIELGMNDVGGPIEAYVTGLKELIAKIRAIPAQPVLISSSPVDDGSLQGDWKSPRCEKLHPFTEAMQKLAAEEKVLFVDQYHPLLQVWGENRRQGAAAAAAKGTPATPAPATPTATAVTTPGATPVVVKAPAPSIPPSLFPLGGDAVHPGEVGQYTMAATILKGLGAEGDVSSATLNASGKVAEAKHCQITEVKAAPGKLSFTRLDERGPWPILPKAKTALELLPEIAKLSQYLLRVTGLPEGSYKVSLDGQPVATVSAKDLAAGWNMTTAFDGALGARSTAVIGLMYKLQVPLNNEWRAASKAKDAVKLAAAEKAIEQCEAEIQTAVQPVALHFDIAK